MDDKKIDEMFRSLQDREIIPSSNALKSLQEALDEADRNKQNRKPIIFSWIAAAVAVIVLAIGLNIYSINKSGFDTSSMVETEVKSEAEKIKTPEEVVVSTQITEEKTSAEKLDNKESKVSKTAAPTTKKPIRNTKAIAKSNSKVEQKSEIQQAEKTELTSASQPDKRKAELLKPIDDNELDLLLQQEQVALAMEELEDEDIMRLLHEAQITLENQGESQFASSEAERLLQQATMEMKADKSLRSILNKAIETGMVEVQTLFKI